MRLRRKDNASQSSPLRRQILLRCRTVSTTWLGEVYPIPFLSRGEAKLACVEHPSLLRWTTPCKIAVHMELSTSAKWDKWVMQGMIKSKPSITELCMLCLLGTPFESPCQTFSFLPLRCAYGILARPRIAAWSFELRRNFYSVLHFVLLYFYLSTCFFWLKVLTKFLFHCFIGFMPLLRVRFQLKHKLSEWCWACFRSQQALSLEISQTSQRAGNEHSNSCCGLKWCIKLP